jgi:DNA-binding transcriptional MerR regulator
VAGYLRIGELSKRTGTPPEVLRAWESRYGLLRPDRSAGGFRLYGDADVARIRRMQQLLGDGLSAAQAAARVAAEADEAAGTPQPAVRREELARALDALDETAAHAAFDRALSELTLDALLDDVVLPYLHDLGARWEEGSATIAQEHFASALLRGRLLGLARGWGRGGAPHALLACGPDEEHDLPLICLGLALRARGWRVPSLGARTPTAALADAAEAARPDVCVVSTTIPRPVDRALAPVASSTRLVLAGAGVDARGATRGGAEVSTEGPVQTADRLAA